MANPSTVNPTAPGKEVARRAYFDGLTNSPQKLIDGVADHIYTVLSIICCEKNDAAEVLNITVNPDAGTGVGLMWNTPLPALSTLVFNDKIVLTGTDELVLETTNTANVDVWVSYIDQDFT